jgi:hypothetical protein
MIFSSFEYNKKLAQCQLVLLLFCSEIARASQEEEFTACSHVHRQLNHLDNNKKRKEIKMCWIISVMARKKLSSQVLVDEL